MLFYSILAILFGLFLMIYASQIYNLIGPVDFLENYFGNTPYGIQIFGLCVIVMTILVTTGGLNFIFLQLSGPK